VKRHNECEAPVTSPIPESTKEDLADLWKQCAELIEVFPNRPDRYTGDSDAVRLERSLRQSVASTANLLCPNESWKGAASVGKGNWTLLPWVAIFDTRETTSAQSGVYPVFHLSSDDPVGMRIGLGVAATEFKGKAKQKAAEVRDHLPDATRKTMGQLFRDVIARPDERISIGSTSLAKGYEKGMIYERFFKPEEIVDPKSEISSCFMTVLSAYKEWVDRSKQAISTEPSPFPTFLQVMRRYQQNKVVYLSPKRGQRYFVTSVDETKCKVDRLDGNEIVSITESSYQKKIELLNGRGGSIDRAGLDNTVARHMTFLQGPDFGLDSNGSTVVQIKSLDDASNHLTGLIAGISSPQLYKPAILLLVLNGAEQGQLTENRIEFDWLLPRFLELFEKLGKEVSEQQLAEGFGRLASDFFWLHAHNELGETLSSDKPTASTIRKRISHALFKAPYWQLILSSTHRQRLRDTIQSKWPELRNAKPSESEGQSSMTQLDINEATQKLVLDISNFGFVFQPWQIATYVTALRTKPFVILAGVSGTGKSKLPALIAKFTGAAQPRRIAVRPDWTDSADVIGFVNLQNQFQPGVVLQEMRAASSDNLRYHLCLIDEMNIARVEHYFAEVLSAIEDRSPSQNGGFESSCIVTQDLQNDPERWGAQILPGNLGIVGTVNMDESTHGFSRKVLDRAFTIELSEIELGSGLDSETKPNSDSQTIEAWPREYWYCKASRLAEFSFGDHETRIAEIVETLIQINAALQVSQLQVGYRTRDEVILFVLNAEEIKQSFRTSTGEEVAPLDLALMMKVLPRIAGGNNSVRRTLLGLIGIATTGSPLSFSDEPTELIETWERAERPSALEGARFPRTASRLCMMWERLDIEGFTSFWL